jgi:16S rRNA (guanine527-N7)-methyltransferase
MNASPLRAQRALLEALQRGCESLGLALPAGCPERLLDYLDLLLDWNRAYNLTAITDPERMVSHHLLDSLAVAPHLQGRRIIDVGSGAGLPGVPLALCFPARQFHLLDSNGKKTRFLFQAKTTLALANLSVHHGRAEAFRDAQGFDTVLARAVGPLGELIRIAGHLLAPQGVLIAMKADLSPGELHAVDAPYNVAACVTLAVPGIERHRQIVRIERTRPANRSDG